MRWKLVTLTPALLFLLASTGLGQDKSCVELCRLDPTNVPPECTCTGDVSISSSSAESLLDMTAAELLEAERAYYAERMGPIDNYWVVVKSNISPIEEVRYFEKEGTADEPYFRMIPITEWAKRETLDNPESGEFERMAAEDPAALLGAFADAYDIMAASPELNANTGGVASGLLGALADGFRDAGGGIDEMNQQMEEDAEEEVFAQHSILFEALWLRAVGSSWIRQNVYYPDRPTPAQRFGGRFVESDEMVPEWVTQAVAGGAITCWVAWLEGAFEWEDADGTPYTIERMVKWDSQRYVGGGGGVLPIYSRIEARTVTAAGFRRVVIEQETDRYRNDGPLIPHRTRRRFSGALTEIVEVVKHLQYNSGPPSQIEIAERTINSIGAVSGADPNVP